MRPLIQSKITNVELAGIEHQLKRIADALEANLGYNRPDVQPGRDFDPDEYSSVSYTDEEAELVQQHLDKRVGGFIVEGPGLY